MTSAIESARTTVTNVIDDLVAKAKSAWETLKSAAGPIWEAIGKAMTGAMEAARSTLQGIWNGILEAIAKVLDAVNLGDWAGKVRGAKWGGTGSEGSSNLKAAPTGQRGRARGGVVKGTQPYTVGEGFRKEYVVNPRRNDNVRYLRAAAHDMDMDVVPRGATRKDPKMRNEGPGWANLMPPKQNWGISDGPNLNMQVSSKWGAQFSQASREWAKARAKLCFRPVPTG